MDGGDDAEDARLVMEGGSEKYNNSATWVMCWIVRQEWREQ